MAADKSLAIRLSIKDAPQFRAALKQAFGEGSAEVKKFDAALAPTARALEGLANRVDPVARGLKQMARDAGTLGQALAQGNITLAEHNRLLELSRQKYAEAGRAAEQSGSGLRVLSGALGTFGIALSAAFAVDKVFDFGRAVVEAGDTVTRLQGRFTALSGSAGAGAAAVQQVFDITSKTGAAVEDTSQAFTQFFVAGQSIGATQAQSARLVETIQKLGVVGGSTMQSMVAGSRQLAQGLAADRFAGDEFKSVMENLPMVARQLADGLGVSIAKLREMSEAGELTAERVFGALEKKAKDADKLFADIPVTVDRAAGQAAAAWTQFAASIDGSIGLSRTLAASLQGIAGLLRNLTPATREATSASLKQARTALEGQLNTTGMDTLRQELAEMRQHPEAYGAEIQSRERIIALREQEIAAITDKIRAIDGEIAAEQEATSARDLAERSVAAAAKASAADAKATKAQVEARKDLDKLLSGLDPKYKAAKSFSEAVMALDEALAANNITVAEHARYVGLAAKAHDEATRKADGLGKKKKELKLTYDRLNDSVKEATNVALDHERRMAAGSKEYQAVIKAEQDVADKLTQEAIPAWEKANVEIAKLDGLLDRGAITQDTYAFHVAKVTRELRDQDPAYKAAQQAAEDYQKELDRIIGRTTDRIVDFGGDALFDVLTGKSEDFWENFKDLALRAFSQIAAEAILRPLIQPLVSGIVGEMPGLFGLSPAASGYTTAGGGGLFGNAASGLGLANTLSGGGLFSGIGNSLGLTGLLGNGTGFLGLPGLGTALSTVGGALGIGSGVATGTMAATTAAGSAAAAEIGSVAAGSALVPGLGASLATIALPLAAVALPLILGGLFKSKPSNQGAEYAFNTGDFSTAYEGTKHPGSMDYVRGFADPIQQVISNANSRYGVTAGAGSVIGFNYGLKEGSSLYYQPSGGGIEDRKKFDFEKGNDASLAAATDAMLVAYLKDADWTGIGARMGQQSATDVATALDASAATTLNDLLADISFAETFQQFVDISAEDLDPVALAMRAVGNEGKALAATLAGNVDTFRTKAGDLGLGAELLEGGISRADAATQGYILTMLGIEAPLDGVAAASARAEAFVADLVPILEAAGFSVERVGEITATVFDNMVADAEAAAAAIAQANIANAINIQTAINQAINPAYQMSAADLFAQQGLDASYSGSAGGYGRLFGLVSGAAAGDQAALQQVGQRLTANQQAGFLTQQQVDAILNYATQGYIRAVQPQAGGYQLANDNDGGGGTTSSGGGSTDNGERDALRAALDARQDELRAIEQSVSAQERLRDSYLDLAERLSKFRQSLLVSELSPLTPAQQLEEARRQFEATLAQAMAGDQDAMRDMEGVSRTLLDKSRGYWASSSGQMTQSVRYQEDFARVQAALLGVEGKARDYQAEAVAQLVTLNASMVNVKKAIEELDVRLDQATGGNGSTPGGSNGGTPGGGTPSVPAGYYLNSAGQQVKILFGRESLGRGANEDVAAFMSRSFKSYTGALTEDAAHAWMLAAHPSGLDGLSRLEYFAAARRAGYSGPFGSNAQHTNFLNADTSGGEWRDFIDRLRDYTDVPIGHWKAFGGPADYAMGGAFDLGNVVSLFGRPQSGSVVGQERLFDIARMGEAGPEAILPLVRGAGGELGVRTSGGGDPAIARGLERLERRLAAIERELQEDKVQRAAATRAIVGAEMATLDAVKRARPRQIDPGLARVR